MRCVTCTILILLALGILSCTYSSEANHSSTSSEYLPGVLRHPNPLVSIPYDAKPYTRDRTFVLDFSPSDENNIHMYEYYGELQYNPVGTALDVMNCLDAYNYSDEEQYLDYSIMAADFFTAMADTIEGGLYYPYEFDYNLAYDDWLMAPWYSGMAQGLWLACLARLHHFTEDPKWFRVGQMVLQSFLNVELELPTAYTYDDSYYWVDEYPFPAMEEKSWVLNGMMYAMYGLYDWWWEFDSDVAADLLRCCLASLKERIHDFRVPWGVSYYCLKYHNRHEYYHGVHIQQLSYMSMYSGDWFFF